MSLSTYHSSEPLQIAPFHSFYGTVDLPGSKSIANRALLCAALAKGTTQLCQLPLADDIDVLLAALPKLGVSLELMPRLSKTKVHGLGAPFSVSKKVELYLANAGTALRPLTAILSAGYGSFVLQGNARMRQRPIGDLVQALQELGVEIHCAWNACPPVYIHAKGLHFAKEGGHIFVRAQASSQYVSALLMAAPLSHGNLTIELSGKVVSRPYIDLTIAVMREFGIRVREEGANCFFIPSPQTYKAVASYTIEKDASAASYFLAAGALPGCGPVRIEGLGSSSRQGDIAFAKLLAQMGASLQLKEHSIEICGPSKKEMPRLRALDVNMNDMPDAAMTLAVLALFCDGRMRIRDIANLRLKESERIEGLKKELEKLGASVQAAQDSLYITPPSRCRPASIACYGDHRMAMSFALAAYETGIIIEDPDCCAKTYKNFFTDFLACAYAH